jgi:hypothetical protein
MHRGRNGEKRRCTALPIAKRGRLEAIALMSQADFINFVTNAGYENR